MDEMPKWDVDLGHTMSWCPKCGTSNAPSMIHCPATHGYDADFEYNTPEIMRCCCPTCGFITEYEIR